MLPARARVPCVVPERAARDMVAAVSLLPKRPVFPMAQTVKPPDRPKANSIKPIRRLFPFIVGQRALIAAAVAALLLAAGFTLALPMALRRVIDHGFVGRDTILIDQYFGALVLVAAGLACTTAARFYLVSVVGERLVTDLRAALYGHLLGMSPGFFHHMRTGEVISRLTADMAVVQAVIGSTVSIALRNLLLLAGSGVMMLVTSPRLALLVAVLVPVVIAPLLALGRRLRRLARESQDRIAEASGIIGEVLQAIAVVQAFTAEKEVERRGVEAVEKAFAASRRRALMRAWLTGLVIFLVSAGIVCVVWLGATDVSTGRMTGGELAQFVLYAVIAGGAAASLSEVWSSVQLAAGGAERIFELLDAKRDIRAPANPRRLPVPAKGAIAFHDVTFCYPTRPEAALDHFSLRIEPGERVALVGPSGAGKSTVLQLLLRFHDPDTGFITLDGADIREVDPAELRARFALVPQDPAIFARSAADNIAIGRPGAAASEIEGAARVADAHQFLSSLPNGYQAWLGERGVMLSGGQSQRVAIARAVLRDAPVLLLDEATSALDAESERSVQEAIARLAKDRTAIAIAHRLATVKSADRIVVMDSGRAVATGSHAELVEAGGLYARYASLQFEDGLGASALR